MPTTGTVVPLLDLGAEYRALREEIDRAIGGVLESGQFILGPNVAALEEEIAAYLGVRHAIGVASGTDALVLSLQALDIGPGDEVVIPVYTFFATAEAVLHVGATPVFVDIDPSTYCLDVGQVEDRITERTRAVIPVHLYGHPADMGRLLEVARRHDLKVVEDNAQAFGAEWGERKTGSLGDVGCLSFFPTKNLGAYGDAGMVVTMDGEVADRVRMLRTHGCREKHRPEMTGYNSRLDELQAAVLRVKLRHVDEWNERRRELARRYAERMADLGISLPREAPDARHVYHLYVVGVPDRDAVRRHLGQAGVASAVYYPEPLHLTPACETLESSTQDFPVAERTSTEALALPLHPWIRDEQVDLVVRAVQSSVASTGSLE